jgi:hypothetical protein
MKLIALSCPHCSRPLAPEEHDVAILCPHCGRPVEIGEDGPAPITVRFARRGPDGELPASWQPYWAFQGAVAIRQRGTQGGGSRGEKESLAFWAAPRRFLVPAWALPVEQIMERGRELLKRLPAGSEWVEVEQPADVRLQPAILFAEEARAILEFIVLSIEAERSDSLKSLAFDLDLGPAELWALPGTN